MFLLILYWVTGPRVPGSQGPRGAEILGWQMTNAMAAPKIYWYPLKPMIYDIYDMLWSFSG